jgi:hypothetical protein
MDVSQAIQRQVSIGYPRINHFKPLHPQTPNRPISTGLASTSLDRAPAPSKSFVRGQSGYVPFWPGGLDNLLDDAADEGDTRSDISALRSIPPGFMRGLRLPEEEMEDETPVVLNIAPANKSKDEPRSVPFLCVRRLGCDRTQHRMHIVWRLCFG